LDKLTYPVYINAHTFQKTDIHLEHKTLYTKTPTPNVLFIESLHDILLRENNFYKKSYDTSFVFDGDSIEFITQNFYNATVNSCVEELISTKKQFLTECSPFFKKWGWDSIHFPDHNYGLATFLSTNKQNLAVCNNGTYHINITLPTLIKNGTIINKNKFIYQHLQFVKCIQMIEPLIVACYGTPDVFSLANKTNSFNYSMGSLRVTLSRYISLQTFDIDSPVNGKLLLLNRSNDPTYWYNQLHDMPYQINNNIGADINFNKFKNHGIEMRFLDWFPEEYLADVMNFFVLLAQHSISLETISFDKMKYQTIIKNCVSKGAIYLLSVEESNLILKDLQLEQVNHSMSSFQLLLYITDILYHKYHNSAIVNNMSPHMKKPQIVNYNLMAYERLYYDLYGKPELIIRSEVNPLESRTTIVPNHLSQLLPYFQIMVESSTTRCFTDEEYRQKGAIIVPSHYWKSSQHSYVIGLKEINVTASANQTHMHFAHCFKEQVNSKISLDRLAPSIFIDYEYMLNVENKRVISFCKQSGKIGCYLALMTYYKRLQRSDNTTTIIPPFNEENYIQLLKQFSTHHKPSVLLIGYGVVGKRCKEILNQFDIQCTIWTSADVKSKDVILHHNILIHAVSLTNHTYPPFLLPEDLSAFSSFNKPNDLYDPSRLSVICDISCDVGNPRNLLPIYEKYTTKDNPVCPLPCCPSIDLIAISNLPSLEPIRSSTDFSSILITYLPALLHFQKIYPICEKARTLYESYQKFLSFIK
jgi:alanine dehydrogenase